MHQAQVLAWGRWEVREHYEFNLTTVLFAGPTPARRASEAMNPRPACSGPSIRPLAEALRGLHQRGNFWDKAKFGVVTPLADRALIMLLPW